MNYIKSLGNTKTQILNGQQAVEVLNGEKDVVIALSGNSISVISIKPPETLFSDFAKDDNWESAIQVAVGSGISLSRLCANNAYKHISNGDYERALQTYDQGNCDISEIIHRFVYNSQDRYALYATYKVILRNEAHISLPIEKLKEITKCSISQLGVKYIIFMRFTNKT